MGDSPILYSRSMQMFERVLALAEQVANMLRVNDRDIESVKTMLMKSETDRVKQGEQA